MDDSGAPEPVDSVVSKAASGTVAEVVGRLVALAEQRRLTIFTVIDHSGEARARGLELRDTEVVVFGNPEAGTPLMSSFPLLALDLPLKVLVWDDAGQTRLSYTAPAALARRYSIPPELAAPLGAVDSITDAIAN